MHTACQRAAKVLQDSICQPANTLRQKQDLGLWQLVATVLALVASKAILLDLSLHTVVQQKPPQEYMCAQ